MSTPVRPRRSVLFMPGSNPRALEKARSLPADAVVIDLEDAVAPDAKGEARARVAATLRDGGFKPREVVVRTNGVDTPWFTEDLAMIAAASAREEGPDALLLPKVNDPETLLTVGRALEALGAAPSLRLWAMIETPIAVLRALDIALAAKNPVSRLAVLALGTNDLSKETGARIVPGRAPMASWLSHCVLAARAGGTGVLDAVWNDFRDIEGFARECAEAAAMGFDGKTLIHPDQIAPCNAAFSPPQEEVAAARALIALFDRPENAGKGVVQIEGRMVERMHADIARQTVALADAIAARM
ncbi:HpcH/HpaI aldolase/citrate lyase family protein [Ancylobacter rudongensis]|uniref:Citrate lyase subunit beta / citryl-CoA lyase n=1 Tax=Ancylobacter rudongensis TaxID=177413 RepID=A0A1G4UC85_9HYPH|nr:CoA ester lyase [Ancylobacter rudongensis]SCW91194.1 citrate lyase subunit beta / citryl-CoA lyase [Ancylobacter rudongensis]